MQSRVLPFTLLFAGLVLGCGLLTGTWRAPISPDWLDRLGMAPMDLRRGAWWRIVTCLLPTHGGAVFWGSLGIGCWSNGLAERRFGTRVAVETFVLAHLASLFLVSFLVVLPMDWMGSALGESLALARDVGGSGGYYGCLGLGIAGLRS
ncbi:MAG TPA: hypothetical protein P5218_03775, partial [Planctomycetota bacterium]|nr:hypothetical protein [Planctomycetota bacterium]